MADGPSPSSDQTQDPTTPSPPRAGTCADRLWWPSAYLDEGGPAGRACPYAWVRPGTPPLLEPAREGDPERPLRARERIAFVAADARGSSRVRVRDGAVEWTRRPPEDATHFVADEDADLAFDSIADLEDWVLEECGDGESVRVEATRVSDDLLFEVHVSGADSDLVLLDLEPTIVDPVFPLYDESDFPSDRPPEAPGGEGEGEPPAEEPPVEEPPVEEPPVEEPPVEEPPVEEPPVEATAGGAPSE